MFGVGLRSKVCCCCTGECACFSVIWCHCLWDLVKPFLFFADRSVECNEWAKMDVTACLLFNTACILSRRFSCLYFRVGYTAAAFNAAWPGYTRLACFLRTDQAGMASSWVLSRVCDTLAAWLWMLSFVLWMEHVHRALSWSGGYPRHVPAVVCVFLSQSPWIDMKK